MITAVDDSHVDVRSRQAFGRSQPAKARADDNDVRAIARASHRHVLSEQSNRRRPAVPRR